MQEKQKQLETKAVELKPQAMWQKLPLSYAY